MKFVKFTYSVGYGHHTEAMEVEDDATEEEIEELIKQAVMERINWSWEIEER